MDAIFQNVPLADLPETIGTPPAERLVENIRRKGVIQPILVARVSDEDGEIHLHIVDGNRRVAAARLASRSEIPAIMFDGLSPESISEATLITNGFRTANYLAEFWAMKQLERSRYTSSDVAAISGMAKSTIALRGSLSHLNRGLFVALRNGEITQTIATAAAKLPREQQEQLADMFHKRGTLTTKDIRAVAGPADSNSNEEHLSPGDQLLAQLRELSQSAASLGYNRGEFLEMASRVWDESVEGSSST